MPRRGGQVDFDDRQWREILQELENLKGRTVRVGILASEEHESGEADVLDIAIFNEFGTEHIPARPFMRGAFDENVQGLQRMQSRLLKQIKSGQMTSERALHVLGEIHTDQVQSYLTSLRQPPNAPSTVRQKGSSNPLIDTGHLRRSIVYEVK